MIAFACWVSAFIFGFFGVIVGGVIAYSMGYRDGREDAQLRRQARQRVG